MPPPIKKLSDKFLIDPKTIEVARPATANINIEQRLVQTTAAKKTDALKELLRSSEVRNAIVFCNRKTTVRDLASALKRARLAVGQIHGDMDQASRIAEFDRFKKDEINILVASDVAARGLDVKGVSHVFNYDVPWQPDDYVHRIGRTGRAGATGIAITLAARGDDELIERIEKLTGQKIERVGASGESGSRSAPASAPAKASEKAEPKARRERKPKAERSRPQEAAEAAPRPARDEQPKKPKPQAKGKPKAADDAESEWNGPLPGFLSVGAG